MNPKDTKRLAEAKGFVKVLKNRMPSNVDARELGCRSKLPWKALSLPDPLLYRIIELADAVCRLYEANLLASAFTLTCSAVETSAMLHWLHTQMDKTLSGLPSRLRPLRRRSHLCYITLPGEAACFVASRPQKMVVFSVATVLN
jgi:hypothetical protein